ncbi:hypothetical protein GCM10017674_58950 [Streptomyces gardneri]|uniref:Uncharacterized protein n=1 Tax=Streptomyces gardneri TaxID=66892 RepID=A0A4Y3RL30_9ACTN|nr:hypothetical protein SGA01_30280 [Streptomyces gardneri]GHH12706.1 hypothetical protein GCM10017674_58950 [Streptomyces gardneri]
MRLDIGWGLFDTTWAVADPNWDFRGGDPGWGLVADPEWG